jgi:hypothetical protein
MDIYMDSCIHKSGLMDGCMDVAIAPYKTNIELFLFFVFEAPSLLNTPLFTSFTLL